MKGRSILLALLLVGCDNYVAPPAYTPEQTIAATKQCQDAGLEVVFFENMIQPGVARGHQCRPKKVAP